MDRREEGEKKKNNLYSQEWWCTNRYSSAGLRLDTRVFYSAGKNEAPTFTGNRKTDGTGR